ncbi:MAG: hypothetical protein K0S32_3685 [Bacteroidetes bacterium]|nr:hypothetical protein [Bacteroidota bacterium]
MKRFILSSLFVIPVLFASAQTATNFTANDCSGNNHDLFTELNSGKVVVISWVMPCGACIAPAQSAHNIVQSYSVSNPGQVVYYVVDDYANTVCSTLNSWISTNGLTNYTSFSNSVISMSNYGAAGMPKTIVVGGSNHQVFYNQNGSVNSSSLTTAINNALAGAPTAIGEIQTMNFATKVSPNPASEEITISYNINKNSDLNIQIFNSIGQEVRNIHLTGKSGVNEHTVNVEDLPAGNYFAKLNYNEKSDLVKLIISR